MLEALGRWQAVWRRNALAWRKSARTALLGGFAEPLFYLFALGYGLGGFIREVEGLSYLGFLMAGILSTSAMNAATFEGLYLAYTRMEVLRTWDSMLAAPLGIDDVVMGEVLWMGTKSLISAGLILIVTALLGMVTHWTAVAVLPVAFLAGICFGGMALVVTSFARSYDFFVYYITLLVTPMVLLSGVFSSRCCAVATANRGGLPAAAARGRDDSAVGGGAMECRPALAPGGDGRLCHLGRHHRHLAAAAALVALAITVAAGERVER